MKLLIAIPIHNEEKYVKRVIDKIHAFHNDMLVIDDGSTDRTPQILARRSDLKIIRHPVNRGYGQSLIDAFAYADIEGYDWVITMDCDEQHEPEKIPDFVQAIETDRWDLISGSRYLQRTTTMICRRGIGAASTRRSPAWSTSCSTSTSPMRSAATRRIAVSAMRRLSLDETGLCVPDAALAAGWSAGRRRIIAGATDLQ